MPPATPWADDGAAHFSKLGAKRRKLAVLLPTLSPLM